MRNSNSFQTLSAIAALALLTGCSGGGTSAIAPKPSLPQRYAQRVVSRYACPSTGPIEYVSDALNTHSVINVYAGKFAGQAPCGQITSGLDSPNGLFVQAGTHDLYVANMFGTSAVQVFHRGQTTPYDTYTNPRPPGVPVDVAVAKDGTVVETYSTNKRDHIFGFLSTWIGGPNGGTFVGKFAMKRDEIGSFVTVKENGNVNFDTVGYRGPGRLWSVSCPAGACGAQTEVTGVSFNLPEGMATDSSGDLLVADVRPSAAERFELPDPTPTSILLANTRTPMGIAISAPDHRLFVVDYLNNDASEYSYPDGALIGSVSGNAGGLYVGIAVDP
jgi:hypothetical protein